MCCVSSRVRARASSRQYYMYKIAIRVPDDAENRARGADMNVNEEHVKKHFLHSLFASLRWEVGTSERAEWAEESRQSINGMAFSWLWIPCS